MYTYLALYDWCLINPQGRRVSPLFETPAQAEDWKVRWEDNWNIWRVEPIALGDTVPIVASDLPEALDRAIWDFEYLGDE